jgi:hypothetical protein
MDYFRNIVLLAAIVGLIAGIGMTVAQRAGRRGKDAAGAYASVASGRGARA